MIGCETSTFGAQTCHLPNHVSAKFCNGSFAKRGFRRAMHLSQIFSPGKYIVLSIEPELLSQIMKLK